MSNDTTIENTPTGETIYDRVGCYEGFKRIEVLDDIGFALDKNNVGQADKDRLMAMNYALKIEVLSH